ncbi:hypothetical protein ACIPL1_01750 [Pseudomonas sp. NPDC090202]|uniref:hypothetical protein n=1 Tax=unclassified Pseudomonas TaxID=196821 RepID=UPI00382DEC8B
MSVTLALDAFETVKRFPLSATLWQRLCQLVGQLTPDARHMLTWQIVHQPLEPGLAEWLRCSVLADLTKDAQWYARQAAEASEHWPADAVMNLLGLAWHHALARAPDRTVLAELLEKVDAPRLLRLLARQLEPPALPEGPREQRPLRIAIYTPQLGNETHGSTLFTLNVMSALSEDMAEVQAFSAQENHIPAIASYHGGTESLAPVVVQPETLRLKRPGEARFTLTDPQFSLHHRLAQAQNAITAYAPDVVLFSGFMSPLMYRLHERYPTVGLSVHALPPLVPVDVWLSAEPEAARYWSGVPEPAALAFPFRFWPKGQAEPIDRVSLGLPADSTLLISVGYRLEIEMPTPWIERMCAWLDRHPQVHWLLVGVAETVPMDSLPRHDRIYRVPPQPQIERWLAASDIMINPPRAGGGGAAALAMEQGVPVLALRDSDAGDKLGPFAVDDIDRYLNTLDEWAASPERRREVGDALRTRFHQRLDFSAGAAASGLLSACRQAMHRFQLRASHRE